MKKNYLVAFLLFIFPIVGIYAQTYSGGTGTAQNPFKISTKLDLNTLCTSEHHWHLHFELDNDINIQPMDYQSGGAFYNDGDGFQTIGYFFMGESEMEMEEAYFTGSFDGKGYKISGVVINMSAKSMYKGFFGCVSNATISNLNLENISVTETGEWGERTGALVGEAGNSTITKCSVISGSVTGVTAVGGLVGSAYQMTITESSSNANVNCSNIYCGGLIGIFNWSNISDSYSGGNVNGSSSIGGLIGYVAYVGGGFGSNVTNCYARGLVSNVSHSGGLIGQNPHSPLNVTNSFWDNQTTGKATSVGGGTGLGTDDMKDESTFTNVGWDFEEIWKMDETGSGYPVFLWHPEQNTSPITKVSHPTCGGFVQSLDDLIYCDPVSGAKNYQWRWEAEEFSVTVSRQAIYNDFKAKMVPGIQNNTTYTVYVRARTDEGWGNFGEACQVHIVGVPETKLQGDCNGMLVSNAENLIYCDAVPGAQNYEWRWVNLNDESVYVRQRNAIYNDFKPSTMLPDIEVGATYLVSVRARVNNVWGEYGDECPITMPSVGLTQVQGTWCNRSLNRLYLTIRTQSVAGATNYQWEWTNTSTNETYTRSRGNVLNDFSTRWVPDFANGQTWSVRVRARANGLWGEYGNACLIHTPPAAMWQNGDNDMASQEMEENLGEPVMKIYPNPSNGEAVRIMMHDISHDTEAIITIYDAYGRQVYSRQLTGIYAGEEVSIKRLARVVLWDVLCHSPSRV
jgi:hypothetical protein